MGLVTKTSPNFEVKTQNTSDIKQWNKSEFFIYLRNNNKNKEDDYFSICLSPVQGLHTHTHTHLYWDNLDMQIT